MSARAQQAPERWAVIGGGWAGLAAAVRATEHGRAVTLFEMAPQLGGRARSLPADGDTVRLDNGQHILIGAYRATLALMATVGVRLPDAFLRSPLTLVDPLGHGLRLPPGSPVPAFAKAVWAMKGWSTTDRLSLLARSTGWALHGFRCGPSVTVDQLTRKLPPRVRVELIEPLCVAALNTPSVDASAAVFLRVLRDALFSGECSADLLLPRQPLAELLPEPAHQWLLQRGARVMLGQRVERLDRADTAWAVNGERFDRVVLACTAAEAARLADAIAPGWAAQAHALRYEPIVTVYLHSPGADLAAPMTALPADAPQREPAQFAFDQGAIAGAASNRAGHFAFVISGAADWVGRGLPAIEAAVRAQAHAALRGPGRQRTSDVRVLRTVAEKRATFRCTPALQRPPAPVAPGLVAAGDYVAGPYPATLEGAVRSGLEAVHRLTAG